MASHQDKEIVLITGGNAGLGFEIAKMMLKDHAGRFHVLIGCRTVSKGEAAVADLHQQGFKDCEVLHIEVTSDDSIAQAAKSVEAKFGRVDVLHVNAGISVELEAFPAGESISSMINKTCATNAAGAAQTAESFVPLLSKAENPRIVFMSTSLGSVSTIAGSFSNEKWPAYSASKAAMNMVFLYFWRRFPEWKINASAPGFRPTALNNFGQGGPKEPGKVELGAVNAVRLSLLGKDGETGTFTSTNDETGKVFTVDW